MSKTKCSSCGQSVLLTTLRGERRTHCPICKSPLPVSSATATPSGLPAIVPSTTTDPERVTASGTPSPEPSALQHQESCRPINDGVLHHPDANWRGVWFWSLLVGGGTAAVMWSVQIAVELFFQSSGGTPHAMPAWANILLFYAAPIVAFGVTWCLCAAGVREAKAEARIVARAGATLGMQCTGYETVEHKEMAEQYMLTYPGLPKHYRRVLKGVVQGTAVEVIQFTHSVRERDTATTRALTIARETLGKSQTVDHIYFAACFAERIACLPDFNLTPVGDIDHFFLRLVPEDRVRWEADERERRFSEMYFLCAMRHELLKTWFGPRLIRCLVENPGWNIQSREGRLLMWRVQPPKRRWFDEHAWCAPLKLESLAETVSAAVNLRHLLVKRSE